MKWQLTEIVTKKVHRVDYSHTPEAPVEDVVRFITKELMDDEYSLPVAVKVQRYEDTATDSIKTYGPVYYFEVQAPSKEWNICSVLEYS